MALYIDQPNQRFINENQYAHPNMIHNMMPYIHYNQFKEYLYELCVPNINNVNEHNQHNQIYRYFHNPPPNNDVVMNEIVNEQDELMNNFYNVNVLYINDNEINIFDFHFKQYLIRYYLCCGRENKVIELLEEYCNEYGENVFELFINYRHAHFNYNTILHHAAKWISNGNIILYIYNMGGRLHYVNNRNEFAEENIHNRIWYNPFTQIIPNSPFLFANEHHKPYYRNELDFENTIHIIQELAGEREVPLYQQHVNPNAQEEDMLIDNNENPNEN